MALVLPLAASLDAREVLEGPTRLGVLATVEPAASPRHHGARLRQQVERLVMPAPGRQLENARAVRIEPQLGHRRTATEVLRREFQLRDVHRSERREGIETEATRRVVHVEGPLLRGEEF